MFRVDEVDASPLSVFHQIEGFVVDKGLTLGDLKGILDAFVHAVFGEDVKTRLRPSYFPFTEPSAELDVSCSICGGKGCRVCKGTGWIEILGCGVTNPHEIANCGYDPKVWTGQRSASASTAWQTSSSASTTSVLSMKTTRASCASSLEETNMKLPKKWLL